VRPAVAALTVDDWPLWRELRLRALAESPGAFGSTLAEWSGAGDTEQRWRGRLRSVAHNLVASFGGEAVGMASGTEPVAGEVELLSMWVAPEARGRGVGEALIDAVVAWASSQGARGVALDVREGNLPAIGLYTRMGFADVGRSSDCEPDAPERRMYRPLGGSPAGGVVAPGT
jgi:ribosomal protein S18 acetylase RimI-like enzyme